MRKIHRYIYILAIALSAAATVSCKSDKAHITGNIVSLPDGRVRLYTYGNRLVQVDSTVSNNGRFVLEQPEMLPDIVFVGFEAFPDFRIPAILDGEEIFISGNLNYKDDITVSGTTANDELHNYIESIRKYDIMARAIELALEDWEYTGDRDDSLQYKRLAVRRDALRRSIESSRAEFVNQNPSSLVSAMFLNISLNDSMTLYQVDSLAGKLDSTMVDNAFSRRLHERAAELSNKSE